MTTEALETMAGMTGQRMTLDMIPGSDFLLFFNLMFSLDSAFMSFQGLHNQWSDEWGKAFFSVLDRKYADWTEQKTAVYAAANELLYYFALRGQAEELGLHFYHNPEAFLRTVILILENDMKQACREK